MWRCGSPKQRVRLGSGRYLRGGGRRRYADANAHCHFDSDRYSNSQRHGYTDSDCHTNSQRHGYSDSDRHSNGVGNRDAATDANTEVGAIRKAAPYASAEAIDFTRPKISGDRSPVLSSSVESRIGCRATVHRVLARRIHSARYNLEQKRIRPRESK